MGNVSFFVFYCLFDWRNLEGGGGTSALGLKLEISTSVGMNTQEADSRNDSWVACNRGMPFLSVHGVEVMESR